jgi:hypothetical protein
MSHRRSALWYKWFRKLGLPVLWSQLDPYGYGIIIFHKGSELIWLFPWKRKNFNCDGSYAVWYCVDLAHGYKSLADIDAFWEEYSAACHKAALREEAAREDFYF